MRSRTVLTAEEQLAKDLSAMDDSKLLVDRLINEAVTSEDNLDTIDRNYRHLEIMLKRDNIINSDADTASYQETIDAAIEYLQSNN